MSTDPREVEPLVLFPELTEIDRHVKSATYRPEKFGNASIVYKRVSGILTKPKGFMSGYDFSMNPYSGCAFGCAYCYAASFASTQDSANSWGDWVIVKENALELLRSSRRRLEGKSVYISSVTDPYQPIEIRLELTRDLLKELVHHQPRVFIQTRSPLVTRDIDIFKEFKNIQINMTVTTDSEEVRRCFEPGCPGNQQRLQAIGEVCAAGIQACITMTPLLPVVDAESFATRLLATGVKRFIVQPFHPKKGQFSAGTKESAYPLIERYSWTGLGYESVREVLRRRLPQLGEGRDGFAPV